MINEARNRVADWVKQMQEASADKRTADFYADRLSLDRAADLEAIYQDMSWVEEMPPPKKKRLGRRIDPKSRDQFAKWIRQTYEWGSKSRLDQLHTAHELAPLLSTVVDGIAPTGERSLRPLAKLRADGYGDYQAEVWQAAVRIAEGEPPTAGHVRRAVTEFLERHRASLRNVAADPRTVQERRAARRAKFIADFDEILAEENRAAKEMLNELIRHYNQHQSLLREEKTA